MSQGCTPSGGSRGGSFLSPPAPGGPRCPGLVATPPTSAPSSPGLSLCQPLSASLLHMRAVGAPLGRAHICRDPSPHQATAVGSGEEARGLWGQCSFSSHCPELGLVSVLLHGPTVLSWPLNHWGLGFPLVKQGMGPEEGAGALQVPTMCRECPHAALWGLPPPPTGRPVL